MSDSTDSEDIPRFVSLAQFLHYPNNPVTLLASQLVESALLDPVVTAGQPNLAAWIDCAKLSPIFRTYVEALHATGRSSLLSSLVAVGRALQRGLKVYRPGPKDCLALERIEPRFPCADYRQPYPCLTVELPREYSQANLVTGLTAEGATYKARPLAIFSDHWPGPLGLTVSVLMDDASFLTLHVRLQEKFESVHAALLSASATTAASVGGSQMSNEEWPLLYRCANIALCASMLFVNYGVALQEPNPAYRQKLVNNITRAKPGSPVAEAAKLANRATPRIMTFKQEVTLYRSVRRPRSADAKTGRHVSPHWRRGHLRNQPCGPKSQDRKLTFVPCVFVNEDDFFGNASDTEVVYR